MTFDVKKMMVKLLLNHLLIRLLNKLILLV